jgi:prolyl-tRNA synthetase
VWSFQDDKIFIFLMFKIIFRQKIYSETSVVTRCLLLMLAPCDDEQKQMLSPLLSLLLIENGLIKPAIGTGLYSLLPLGIRSLNKLIALVDSKMNEVGARKISLPILVANDLWVKSGRFQNVGPEPMKMKDQCNTHQFKNIF